MKTVTFAWSHLAAVRRALMGEIKALEERISLIGTDYANDPAAQSHWRMFYGDELDVARQALVLVEA